MLVEEKYFRKRIQEEVEALYQEDTQFISDIKTNVTSVKQLAQSYSEIFVRIEELSEEFQDQFGSQYEAQSHNMNKFIRSMKKNIQTLKKQDLQAQEEYKVSIEMDKLAREKNMKICISNNLHDNVCERMSCLELKCSKIIEDLSDSQILEIRKDIKTLDSDFNNILDRVTKLSESNPSETKDLMIIISKRKNNLKASMNLFKINLGKK